MQVEPAGGEDLGAWQWKVLEGMPPQPTSSLFSFELFLWPMQSSHEQQGLPNLCKLFLASSLTRRHCPRTPSPAQRVFLRCVVHSGSHDSQATEQDRLFFVECIFHLASHACGGEAMLIKGPVTPPHHKQWIEQTWQQMLHPNVGALNFLIFFGGSYKHVFSRH